MKMGWAGRLDVVLTVYPRVCILRYSDCPDPRQLHGGPGPQSPLLPSKYRLPRNCSWTSHVVVDFRAGLSSWGKPGHLPCKRLIKDGAGHEVCHVSAHFYCRTPVPKWWFRWSRITMPMVPLFYSCHRLLAEPCLWDTVRGGGWMG